MEYLLKASHPSAKTFITMLGTLGGIVDEIGVTFTAEGVGIKALDPARIALINILIPSSAFMEYVTERELTIGINLSSILKILPSPKKSDRLTLLANEEFYELIIEGAVTRRYKFRCIEVASTEVPELSLEFKVRGVVLASAFKSVIKDLEGGEGIEFYAESSDNLILKSVGLGAQAKLSRASGSVIDLEVIEPSKATYDTEYLSKILDLVGIAETLELKYGSDIPISINFKLVDGSSVNYLLAPKV